jgi:hypothetical protein
MHLARTVLVVALAALGACNETLIVRTDGPYIGENGISVPVPPPSFSAAPVQFVEVVGELGVATPEPKTKVFLYEATSDRGYFVHADSEGDFQFVGVELDLHDNCLEVWFEEPGPYGTASVHSFFTAMIGADDQSIVTDQLMAGC